MSTTNYLLDAIKEGYIEQAKPQQLNINPVEGLREKENFLKKLTPSYLNSILEDYEGLEASAAFAGDSLIPFMLKLSNSEQPPEQPSSSSAEPIPEQPSSSSSST